MDLTRADCGFSYRNSRFKGADAGRFVVCDVPLPAAPGAPTLTYPDVALGSSAQGIASPDVGDVRDRRPGDPPAKGMVLDAIDPDTRSVGSFFMNPVVAATDRERLATLTGHDVPAARDRGRPGEGPGRLADRARRLSKGDAAGPVGISTQTPARDRQPRRRAAADVVRFAAGVKRRVADRFGVWLRPEPVFVGFDDDAELPDLQYLRKAHP